MGGAEPVAAQRLHVEVAYSPAAGRTRCVSLLLPAGATLEDAIAASGLGGPARDGGSAVAGIWGRIQPASTLLRDHDRVEIYRPLQVDPKEARRIRYKARDKTRRA